VPSFVEITLRSDSHSEDAVGADGMIELRHLPELRPRSDVDPGERRPCGTATVSPSRAAAPRATPTPSIGPGGIPSPWAVGIRHRSLPSLGSSAIVVAFPRSFISSTSARWSEAPTAWRYISSAEHVDRTSTPDSRSNAPNAALSPAGHNSAAESGAMWCREDTGARRHMRSGAPCTKRTIRQRSCRGRRGADHSVSVEQAQRLIKPAADTNEESLAAAAERILEATVDDDDVEPGTRHAITAS
jgi:hypothetical protein